NSILVDELDTLGPQLLDQIDGLVDFAVTVQNETGAAVADDIATIEQNTVIAALAALAIGTLCAFLIAHAIVVPIRAITGYMGRLADGDTDFANRKDDRNDEIGKMMLALKSLKATVKQAFTQAQMIQEIPTGVIVADGDADLTITYLNKEARQVLKQVSIDAIEGTPITRLHPTLDANRETFQTATRLPWSGTLSVGPEKLSIQATPVLDRKGSFVGPMFAMTVITERDRMADSFEKNVKGTVDALTTAFAEMRE
ncbi:unnamed protein product, partial [Chrysoparadoxa australica]